MLELSWSPVFKMGCQLRESGRSICKVGSKRSYIIAEPLESIPQFSDTFYLLEYGSKNFDQPNQCLRQEIFSQSQVYTVEPCDQKVTQEAARQVYSDSPEVVPFSGGSRPPG